MKKFAVTLETLKSNPINDKAIEKGIGLWKRGCVAFEHRGDDEYWAQVDDRGGMRGVVLAFSRDGCELSARYCTCNPGSNGIICKHIVATVLAIQDGIVETNITLGRTATVSAVVSKSETACAVGSGSMEVFATPMMIALMERAACEVLSDGFEAGQTSVGTHIAVSHVAASPIGSSVFATATITSVAGHKIEFAVTASDGAGEIGRGTHTRVIVDVARFMAKAEAR